MSTHTDALLDGQREALELIVQDRPLPEVLGALCRVVEEQAGGTVRAAIMLVDEAGACLRSGAAPGHGAVAAARGFRPDVVFLDIGLPGMSGYEVARQLRAELSLKGVRIAALTGWGADEDRRLAREAGFDDHLVKPVDPARVEAVLAAVAMAVAGGRARALSR